jgi:serine protease
LGSFRVIHWTITFMVINVFSSKEIFGQVYQFVPGEVIVQTRSMEDLENLKMSMQNLSSRAQQSETKKVAFEKLQSSILPIALLRTDENNVEELLREIYKRKETVHVQRNRVLQLRSTPNDPDFIRQWSLNNPVEGFDSNILKAWKTTTGGITATGDTIVVAIIDDGVGRHDDLVKNLWINNLEIPGDGIDNDGNGFIDDYYGWNSQNKNDNIFTDERHGTAIAGLIGASGNNGLGIAGINWNVKLMIIDMGNITEANALSAYSYVYEMRKLYNDTNGKKGAFIVVTNSSWGIDFGKAKDAPIWCEFYNKLGEVGILNCVATVNKDINIDVEGDLPTTCTSEYLIGVTNVNRLNEKNNDASFGKKSIDLGAYGQRAYSTTSNNRYAEFVGTSSATPHVVGAIALAYSVPCDQLIMTAKNDPSQAARLVKHLLLSTVTPNSSLINKSTSSGLLNIGNLVEATQKLCENCNLFLTENDPETIEEKFSKINVFDPKGNVDLRLKKAEDTVWTYFNDLFDGDFINLPDLCTEMEYQVRHQCNNTALDSFGYSRYFYSYGCCTPVTNLNVTYNNQNLNLTNSLPQLVDFTQFEYRLKDDIIWKSFKLINQGNVSDISDCQLYEYRAYNSCLNQRTLSDTTSITNVSTQCGNCTLQEYCLPNNVNNRQEWIDSVAIGNNVWQTGKGALGYNSLLSYKIPILRKGIKYPISIGPGYLGTAFRQRFYVYLDLNQNGIFEKEELVLSSLDRSTSFSDSLIIPPVTLSGITRMRIIMSFTEIGTPCEINELFGEVEDYCVNIEEATHSPILQNSENYISNPVSNFLHIDLHDSYDKTKINYTIFDMNGKIILKGKSEGTSIDCTYLKNGIYLINLSSPELNQTFKFVKI